MNKTKKTLLVGAAIAALTTGSALAADMPVKAPPPAAPPPMMMAFNWSGLYIGAHVGGAFGTKNWSADGVDLGSHDTNGVLAGGQIGFNWQVPGSNWVLGIEGDASWTNADGEHSQDGATFRSELNWIGTVTGRLGYAFDRVLIYAKGGFAFAGESHDLTIADVTASTDKTRTGWTVGGGLEFALDNNWSMKGEYNFIDLGNKNVSFVSDGVSLPVNIDQQIHVAKFGINYRFGAGGPPVAARY